MSGYDRGGYHPFERGGRGRSRQYGAEYPSGWSRSGGPEGGWSWGAGRPAGWSRGESDQAWGYDRGIYGGSYPTYGGVPGGGRRGMYYGGRGYEVPDYGFRNDQEGRRSGYDQGFSRQRFVPEEVFRRQPEPSSRRGSRMGAWHGETDRFARSPDDDEVRDEVRHNLFNDSWLDAGRIDVQVSDGVVTLTGEVGDYMEARYAWDDAWEASGVRGVLNQLTVRAAPSAETAPANAPAKEQERPTTSEEEQDTAEADSKEV